MEFKKGLLAFEPLRVGARVLGAKTTAGYHL